MNPKVPSPILIDLFCGLGGWSEGFLAEGYQCIGFDIERHRYLRPVAESGAVKRPGMNWSDRNKRGAKAAMFNCPQAVTDGWDEYPGQLVLQNVLTLHGSQFRDAACIVASPPCQKYSYMAMPWTRAKRMADYYEGSNYDWPRFGDGIDDRDDDAEYRSRRRQAVLNSLFNACFRIQREASEAAGRHIPLVVENVCGAQRWVGPAAWHFGSYYLWGDVPALMPMTLAAPQKFNPDGTSHGQGSWFAVADSKERGSRGKKNGAMGGSWFPMGNGAKVEGNHGRDGLKLKDQDGYERNHEAAFGWKAPRTSSSAPARKAASAAIAKIPFELANWIARCYKPQAEKYADR